MEKDVLTWHSGDEMPPEGTAAIVDVREPASYLFDDYEHLGLITYYSAVTYSCFGIIRNGKWELSEPFDGGHFDVLWPNQKTVKVFRWAAVPFLFRSKRVSQEYKGEEAAAVAERLKDIPFANGEEKLAP